MNEILSRISVDPRICFGKPCVRGMRIWVSLLLDFLAFGAAIEEILENYPQLKREDLSDGGVRRLQRQIPVAANARVAGVISGHQAGPPTGLPTVISLYRRHHGR